MANGSGILQQFVKARGGLIGQRGQEISQQGQQAEQDRFLETSNLRSMALGALELRGLKDQFSQDTFLNDRIARIEAEGGDPRDSIEILNTPFEQRAGIIDNVVDIAERAGALQGIPGAGPLAKAQKTSSFLIRQPDGSTAIAVGVFDPNTKKLTTEIGQIDGEVISRIGETAAERQAREVATKGAGKVAEQEAIIQTAGQIVTVKKGAERQQTAINDAFSSVGSLPTINRALELLNSVETGGIDQASLRAKQLFGVESADEGELSNLLSKAVLSQLRNTFGAAFTAEEGKSLIRIEAGFGKSPAANIRLLKNARAIASRAVDRGIRAAKRAGQTEDVKELQRLKKDILQPVTEASQAGQVPTVTTQAEFDALPSGATFIEDGVTMVKE